MTALNEAFNKRYAVERNVRLETVIWDEICDGIVSPETITAIKEKAREDGVELLIGLAGVQSNQYPRGRDPRASVRRRRHPHDDGRIPRKRLSPIRASSLTNAA